MEVSARDIDVIFRKLDVSEKRGADHRRGLVCDQDGRALFPIFVSLGRKGLNGHVAHLFRKSLKLNEREFDDLRKCPLSRDAYLKLISTRLDS